LIRPDGKLTHDLDPVDHGPKDACGVFGVWAPGEDVAKLTYYGLYAIQHRGQESAGIATSNGKRISVYKDMGLVSQVFDEATLSSMPGDHAIGHARYSTTGASHWANAQPTLGTTPHGTLCLAHNGNLTNSADLYDRLLAKNGGKPPAFGELARGGLPLSNKLGEAGFAVQMLPRLAVAHAAHGGHIGMQRGVVLPQLAHFV